MIKRVSSSIFNEVSQHYCTISLQALSDITCMSLSLCPWLFSEVCFVSIFSPSFKRCVSVTSLLVQRCLEEETHSLFLTYTHTGLRGFFVCFSEQSVTTVTWTWSDAFVLICGWCKDCYQPGTVPKSYTLRKHKGRSRFFLIFSLLCTFRWVLGLVLISVIRTYRKLWLAESGSNRQRSVCTVISLSTWWWITYWPVYRDQSTLVGWSHSCIISSNIFIVWL